MTEIRALRGFRFPAEVILWAVHFVRRALGRKHTRDPQEVVPTGSGAIPACCAG
jgi:hypothetical protein